MKRGLVKKQIVDKTGKRTSVWVNPTIDKKNLTPEGVISPIADEIVKITGQKWVMDRVVDMLRTASVTHGHPNRDNKKAVLTLKHVDKDFPLKGSVKLDRADGAKVTLSLKDKKNWDVDVKSKRSKKDSNLVPIADHKKLLDDLIADIEKPNSQTSDASYKEAKTMVSDLQTLSSQEGKSYAKKVEDALSRRDNAPKKGKKFEPRVLHATYGSAIDEAAELATQSGYNKQSSDDVGAAFMDAFFKPKRGQTNRKSIEMIDDDGKLLNTLHVQIYNRGTEGNTFELNTYFDKKPRKKKA